MKKIELKKSQVYAVKAARQELQSIIEIIAKELELDIEKEAWVLTGDSRYFEKRETPKIIDLEKEREKKDSEK